MSVLFGALVRPWAWLRRAPQTDYEEVLSGLQADIDSVQTKLVHVRTRKRRATIILPLWASLFWATWAILAYFLGYLSNFHLDEKGLLVWGPILAAPILIFFTRRIVRWWYKRVQAAEEEHLKELKRQRTAKIEEIKRATKYDHLRMLLDKYDEDSRKSAPGTPLKPAGDKGTPKGQAAPQTPVKTPVGPNGVPSTSTRPGSVQQPPPDTARLGPTTFQPSQPLPSGMRSGQPPQINTNGRPAIAQSQAMPRTWLDRVADAVLGSDGSGSSLGPEQKYALICTSCKKHNGLAAREEFDEIQYICPHCGTFNTRRPSSVPVSSPWKTPGQAGARESGAAKGTSRSSLRPSSRLMDDADEQEDTDSSSAPPSSPLGGKSSDQDGRQETMELQDRSKEDVASQSAARKRTVGPDASMSVD